MTAAHLVSTYYRRGAMEEGGRGLEFYCKTNEEPHWFHQGGCPSIYAKPFLLIASISLARWRTLANTV